jgi:topoisomerase-4 subunit B
MKQKAAEFSAGNLVLERKILLIQQRKGTKVTFIPDEAIFRITNSEMSM